jgi:hypothetical protein
MKITIGKMARHLLAWDPSPAREFPEFCLEPSGLLPPTPPCEAPRSDDDEWPQWLPVAVLTALRARVREFGLA